MKKCKQTVRGVFHVDTHELSIDEAGGARRPVHTRPVGIETQAWPPAPGQGTGRRDFCRNMKPSICFPTANGSPAASPLPPRLGSLDPQQGPLKSCPLSLPSRVCYLHPHPSKALAPH